MEILREGTENKGIKNALFKDIINALANGLIDPLIQLKRNKMKADYFLLIRTECMSDLIKHIHFTFSSCCFNVSKTIQNQFY